jgi:hypothetical protein
MAAWTRVVRFLTNRPANRRVAHVQKMDPKETAIPDPARTKLGSAFMAEAVVADRAKTLRANNKVTDDTVVKISCAFF